MTPRTEAGKGLDNDLFRVMGHGDDCADCVSDYANFGYTEQIAKAEAEAAALTRKAIAEKVRAKYPDGFTTHEEQGFVRGLDAALRAILDDTDGAA